MSHEDEFCQRVKTKDPLSSVYSVQLRHTYVEEDQIGLEFLRSLDPVESVRRFADDFEPCVLERRAKDAAERLIIFNDQNPDNCRHRRSIYVSFQVSIL